MKSTACLKCRYFQNMSLLGDMTWYYCLCKASPKPLEFNPLTGEMEKPNPEFKFCREVNHGDCPYFCPLTNIN